MSRRGLSLIYCARGGIVPAALLVALAGCDAIQGLGSSATTQTGATESGSPGILRIEEREVERPDIYSVKARGLWDGRFSLGGRWVAVEEKVEAERVRITNSDNGRVIEGALFPREFDLPGPPIMVSMDAATALGMQAGTPANLEVVVLRTETVEIPAPPPPAPPTANEMTGSEGENLSAAGDASAPEQGLETGTLATSTLSAAPLPTADGSTQPQPRIQVAGGANKEGAEAVARRLKNANISAQVAETTSNGKPFYRVFAGPFADKAELEKALAEIRKLGYADAFLVN